MPLEAGAKPGTPGFGRNIATEVRAGKPVKQAAAIAYAKARGDTDITSTFVSPAQMAIGKRADLLRQRADAALREADLRGDADDRAIDNARRHLDTVTQSLLGLNAATHGAQFEALKKIHEKAAKDLKDLLARRDSIRPDGWRRRQGDLKKGKGRRDEQAREDADRRPHVAAAQEAGHKAYREAISAGKGVQAADKAAAEAFDKVMREHRKDASTAPIAGYGPGDMLETKGDAGPGRREREAAFGWDPKWGKQPYDQHVRQNLMNDVPAVKEQTRQRRSEHSYVKAELKAGRRPYGDSLTAKLDALVERADAEAKEPDRQAYRGYLIKRDMRGDYHVSKDGHHITTQSSLAAAKHQIDQVA